MRKLFSGFAAVALAAICLMVSLCMPQVADAGGFGNRFICQVAWTPTALATLTTQTKTIVCPGAVVGDFVDVSFNADILLLKQTGYVSAANTVTVLLYNSTAGTITPTSTAVYVSVTAKYISP